MLSGAHLCQEKAAYIQYLATDSACEKVTHPGKGVHKAYSCERLVFQGFNAYPWIAFRYNDASRLG